MGRRFSFVGILVLTSALSAGVSTVAFADGWARTHAPVAVDSVTHIGMPPAPRDSSADSSRSRRLAEVVVTASRRSQKVSDAVVTTELILHDDIVRSGAQDLQGVLIQHLGVQPEPSSVASGGIQIQGVSSERVLILIDGQPLVGRIDGALDVSRIPTSVIDRIEVIKGPQSTLYGSAAMGGVINIITRGGYRTPPTVSADVTGGSQNRLDADVAMQGGTDQFNFLGGIGRRVLDQQPGRVDQQDARERRWDGDGKMKWTLNDAVSVTGSVLGITEDQRWNGGPIFYFSDNDQLNANLSATILHGLQRFTPSVYFSTFTHLSRQAAIPEPVSDSGDWSREALARAELTYSAQFGESFLDAGVDLDRQTLRTDRILSGYKVLYSAEPYAQYTWNAGALSVVPGVRVSYSDQWGTHITPKLAALYHLTSSVSLRASAGYGYRAPDFKELYLLFLNTVSGFSYVVNGNPDLKPETSRNLSGGIEWNGDASFARLQLFDNQFSRFIETEQVGTNESGASVYTYQNVSNAVTRGADVEMGTAIGRLSLEGAYEYLSAFQRDSNVALLDNAKHSGHLGADYTLPRQIRTGLTWYYTSRAPEARADGVTTYRSAYTHVDARVAKTIVAGLDVRLGVQNGFDTQPTDWPGYAGRQWYAGFSLAHGF
jgi:outer membrane receptor for ferrienterochelin and colicins